MRILHFTDFHFGNSDPVFNKNQLASALISWLKNDPDDTVIVISGDVTLQGNKSGYSEAVEFFQKILVECDISRNNVILCPGNHDIIEQSFDMFDDFSYALRRDNKFLFSKHNSVLHVVDDILFEVFNSSFHLNHKYGFIDNKCFTKDAEFETEYSHVVKRFAITHHHLLGMFENDTSAIRNAYEFVSYLDKYQFDYLLHGHQHAVQYYFIGEKPIQAISIRSGNYNQEGFLNAINSYKIEKIDSKLVSKALIFEKKSSGINIVENNNER
ncbi:metallophosphoesterase family protein [Psychrobacter maritimus]|uniref:metallophosphoesterase family protein n=1 Tax=Psychrobacter maritimus TaxID=256325 RepID=UPI0039B0CB89